MSSLLGRVDAETCQWHGLNRVRGTSIEPSGGSSTAPARLAKAAPAKAVLARGGTRSPDRGRACQRHGDFVPGPGLLTPRAMPRVVYARETRFGGYLEDFEVGDTFHHWPGKTITEAEAHHFCMLTMAVNPLHLDAHYAAREAEGGKNIVVGTYIYALLLGMSVPDISGRAIANLGTDHLHHVAPVHHGDTLYGTTEVTGPARPGHVRRAGCFRSVQRGLTRMRSSCAPLAERSCYLDVRQDPARDNWFRERSSLESRADRARIGPIGP